MANIDKVDYAALAKQAKQMRETGEQLNNELLKAYKEIEAGHSAWNGKRYNDLLNQFNGIREDINQILILVVGEIPFTLETIANNYSQAEQHINITLAEKTLPKSIAELTRRDDKILKFEESRVSDMQKAVTTCLLNAKDQMNTLSSQYERIDETWKSDASEIFKDAFNGLKTKIIDAFGEINSSFVNLMKQAKEDIRNAENANMG